jgi:two-component system nitrate/nitrite response regulator NarL
MAIASCHIASINRSCELTCGWVSQLGERLRAYAAPVGVTRFHIQMRESPCDSFGLTCRELAVVRRIVAGGADKSIAGDLAISGEAIKRHIAIVFAKLNVSNRLELALFALYPRLNKASGFHGE